MVTAVQRKLDIARAVSSTTSRPSLLQRDTAGRAVIGPMPSAPS